jgi:hypothetical protein
MAKEDTSKACFIRPGVVKLDYDFSGIHVPKQSFDEDIIVVKKPTNEMVRQATKRSVMIFCFVQIPEGLNRDAWLEGFMCGRGLKRDAHLCFFDCFKLSIEEGVKLIKKRYNNGELFKMNLGVLPTNRGVNVIIPDELLAGSQTGDAKTTYRWGECPTSQTKR